MLSFMRIACALLLVGCGGGPPAVNMPGADASMPDDDAAVVVDSGIEAAMDAGADAAIGPGDVLAKLANCNELTVGRYRPDDIQSEPATIAVCGLKNAVFWKADMDVDCDGKITMQCSPQTDPAFQNQTAAVDSKGQPLDAANLPYVVVPTPSTQRWDYRTGPLQMGSTVLVLYNGKMAFGILGDVGPSLSIGEASYAMVAALGADPNPKMGGVDPIAVTYLAFTGKSGVVTKNEDHAEAVSVGQKRLVQFMQEN